jgi:hypothetical protein
MSPAESAVKISDLGCMPHTRVNANRNEPGSHDILSLARLGRLNMG